MPGVTAWVLAEQLSLRNPALEGADRVLVIESRAALTERPHHRQKLHLVLTALRSFARELGDRGVEVDVRPAATFADGVREHVRRHRPREVRVLEPTGTRARAMARALPGVRVVPGTLFLTSEDEFAAWADGRRRLRMEDFYRHQRRRLGILMDGDEPAGGRWNLDAENRRTPPAGMRPPAPYRPREGAIDAAVRRDLDRMGPPCSGEDGPRRFPATRAEARRALRAFVDRRLAGFGPYQDAMRSGERFMWHSLLAAPLNLGLLAPGECAAVAERAWREGRVPLRSAEGFVRQVIGWREFVRGVYGLRRARWARANALRARGPLPQPLRTGRSDMRCVAEAVGGVRATGYAHHIERLMVLGNLMLLAGTRPAEALAWFQASFVDGHEWVMAPNVLGMALWADGGAMTTKPYAAGGSYVSRMSDHCGGCRYDPRRRSGPDACPLTTLYWDFLHRHRRRLSGNPRMSLAYRALDRLSPDERAAIARRAAALREEMP